MVVGSTATNGFKYIRDIVMDKLEFNLYCAKVVEILVKYEEISYVYVEKNTFQGADIIKIKELIAKEPKLRNRKIEFANEMQRTNKEEKISTIIDDVNNGRIIFVDNNPKAIEQLLDYQGEKYSLHDDFVDCVAECSNRFEKVNTNNVISLLDRKLLW